MAEIALKLSRRNTPEVALIGRNISKKVKANVALFPNLPVDLKTLDLHISDLEDAHVEAMNGGSLEKEIREEKRATLEDTLKQYGLYVTQVSQGNSVIMRKAGMPLKGLRGASKKDLAAPNFLKVEAKVSGQANLVWDKVANSRNYIVEHTDNLTTNVWTMVLVNTRNKAIIKGLTKSKEYFFRVCATGANGVQSPWTAAMSIIIQ